MAMLGGCVVGPRVRVAATDGPRSYLLVAPPRRDDAPRPLVIALHGWLGTPEQMAWMSRLSYAAWARGFVVVYPQGEWRAWGLDPATRRGAADAAFLATVVADISARTPIDPARIYAVGFSNGGFMAQALACSGRVHLAGIAIVAAGLAAGAAADCIADASVPFLLIQGTGDPILPVQGTGDGLMRILRASDTLAFWAKRNDCRGFADEPAASREAGVTVTHRVGQACSRATEAWFIAGAGHGWPGSNFAYPEFLVGRRTWAIDATSVIVAFLMGEPALPSR
jgi:polyhydroxybutyrate depolymerase